VPAHVKAIPIGSNVTHYLGWNGSAWISRKVDWSEIGNKPVLATQYTDAMAISAVTGIFQDTKTIDLVYEGGLIKAHVIIGEEDTLTSNLVVVTADGYLRRRPVTSLPHPDGPGGSFSIIEIKFTVGDIDYPQHGDTEYTPLDGSFAPLLIGKKVMVYREGDAEFGDETAKGITLNSATGTLYFYPDLNLGEDVRIWVFESANIIPYVPYTAPLLLVGPGEELSIDGTDNLEI
jgi:hypothetical protein